MAEAREGYERIDTELDALPNGVARARRRCRALTIEDKCLYIYTSGTTGLPKAANINHYRVQGVMSAFTGAMRMRRRGPHLCLPAALSHLRRRARRPARR